MISCLPVRALLGLVMVSTVWATAGCGGAPERDILDVPPHEGCAVAVDARFSEDVMRQTHANAERYGAAQGRLEANTWVSKRTHDGYALRRTATRFLMGVSLLLLGVLLSALLLNALRRPPPLRYAERLGGVVGREASAVRGLASGGDSLTGELIARLEAPLAHAERKAERLVDQCVPLERQQESVSAQSHLESLYRQLEGLVARIERMHVSVMAWQERLQRHEDDAVKREVTTTIADLEAALAEVS